MSGDQIDMEHLCRLCLCDDGKVPIFPSGPDNTLLSKRIFQCVAVQVDNDGKLPLNICSGCVSCIDSWFLFKEKCHKTQNKLQTMVRDSTSHKTSVDNNPCNGDGGASLENEMEEINDDQTGEPVCSDNLRSGLRENENVEMESAKHPSPVQGQGAPQEVDAGVAESAECSKDSKKGQNNTTDVDSEKSNEKTHNLVDDSSEGRKQSSPSEGENMDVDDCPVEEDEEYEDFEEDLDEFDEPPSTQLLNPKFAAKLMNMKTEAAQKPSDSGSHSTNLRKADSTDATPTQSITFNLCEEEDEDDDNDDGVSVVEPEIEKIVLDEPEQITSTVNQDSAGPDVTTKLSAAKDENLRIQSAVTLPAPGNLFKKDSAQKDVAAVPSEPQGTAVPSTGASRDNSPDRMSVVEDDQFEDDGTSQDAASAPHSAGDPLRTTPDSTMVTANPEDESQLSVDFVIKEETNRGYADEEEASMASFDSGSSVHDKTRDEYLREMLLSDPTVDVNNDKCIVCDHVFYTVASLLRHTKCRMHLDTKAIWEMQQRGEEVDPMLLAMNQRKLESYRQTWNISRKRTTPQVENSRPGLKKFTCKPCKISACSYRDWDRHKQSKKHKLIMMLGEMPSEVDVSEKKAPRKIVRPQPLQYDHEPPQHLPKPIRPKPVSGQSNREFICPIPNCGYICYEGSLLLTHMTSHGIQGQTPVQPSNENPMQQPASKPALLPPQSASSFSQGSRTPYHKTQKYENLFCKYHNIFFETARGYLNHIRHCAMAPPISQFLRPEFKGTAADKRYCRLCDLSFSTPEMLIQHMGVYHKGSAVQQEVTRPPAPVFMPKATAKSGVKHKCHLCGKVFNLLHSLNFHLRSHRQQVSSSTSSNTTCKVCKKVFLTRKSCATHLKTHFLHPGSNKMFCSLCYKTFDTRSEIARHRYDGTCITPQPASGPFNCDQCDFTCKESMTLSNHKLKFHTDIKKEKPEDEQNVSLENEDTTEDYNEESVPPSSQPQIQPPPQPKSQVQEAPKPLYNGDEFCKCMLCGKTFHSYANVRRHCRFIHRMPDSKVDNMVKMMINPSGSKGPLSGPPPLTPLRKPAPSIQTCGRCGENFQSKQELHEHFEICQEDAQETPCDQCGVPCGPKGCDNCSQQKNQGELLFKCPIGHMSFNDENAMLKHYSYCTGKCGPYFECGNCGCEFRYRKNFDIHNCAIARKRPSYDCAECHRSFSKKSYLINHEMKCPNLNSSGGGGEGSPCSTSTPYNSNGAKKTRQSGPLEEQEEEGGGGEGGDGGNEEVEAPPPEVFSCQSCERIFHSSKALCGHMRSHREVQSEDPMFCKFCGRENLTLSNLYQHVYKCTKSLFMTEEVLTCEECSTFLSRYDTPKELSAKLHHHILNCYPIPWYQNQGETAGSEKLLCYICCHAFSSVESLTIHKAHHNRVKAKRGSPFLKSTPKKRPKFGYFRTPKLEFDPNDMIEEEVLESGDGSSSTASATQFILNCQVCNRQFNNIDKLRNHEKVHGIVRQVVTEESEGIENEEQTES